VTSPLVGVTGVLLFRRLMVHSKATEDAETV
jgi:hypothetical protein